MINTLKTLETNFNRYSPVPASTSAAVLSIVALSPVTPFYLTLLATATTLIASAIFNNLKEEPTHPIIIQQNITDIPNKTPFNPARLFEVNDILSSTIELTSAGVSASTLESPLENIDLPENGVAEITPIALSSNDSTFIPYSALLPLNSSQQTEDALSSDKSDPDLAPVQLETSIHSTTYNPILLEYEEAKTKIIDYVKDKLKKNAKDITATHLKISAAEKKLESHVWWQSCGISRHKTIQKDLSKIKDLQLRLNSLFEDQLIELNYLKNNDLVLTDEQKQQQLFLKEFVEDNEYSLQRNHRVILDSDSVKEKLEKELYYATNSSSSTLTNHKNSEQLNDVFVITDSKTNSTHTVTLTGVFKDHEGTKAAKFIKKHLKAKLEETFERFQNKTLTGSLLAINNEKDLTEVAIWNILKITCVELSEEFQATGQKGGATGSFSIQIGDDLWTANVGYPGRTFTDSNGTKHNISESVPQTIMPDRTSNSRFATSFYKRGGSQALHGTRSFGDRCTNTYTNRGLTARPKITKITLPSSIKETSSSSFPASGLQVMIDPSDNLSDVNTTSISRPDREYRVITDPAKIREKLKKEQAYATSQMEKEQTKSNFQYKTASSYFSGYFSGFTSHTNSKGAVAHVQGKRDTQEDEDVMDSFSVTDRITGASYNVQLTGIFDGHGGNEASQLLKARLKIKLEETFNKLQEQSLTGPLTSLNNENGLTDVAIWNILKISCVELSNECNVKNPNCGSTGSFSLLINGNLWTANVGDSRTILVGEKENDTIQLSEDAKPGFKFFSKLSETEFDNLAATQLNKGRYEKSVWKRGGSITSFPPPFLRVNCNLAVIRAFGDKATGDGLTSRCKITKINLTDLYAKSGSSKWKLVHACDGLWDVASSKQVANAIREHKEDSSETLATNLCHSAIEAGSRDNVSCLIQNLF